MTVASTLCRRDYTANGVTTAFAADFYFLADADLAVYVTDLANSSTLKTLTTDYTVSGAGNPAGGTVTFNTAPTNNYRVSILRGASLLQPLDLADNDPLPADSVEMELDRLLMQLQQVKERLDHAIRIQPSESSALGTLPPASLRANMILGFDASGNPIPVAGTLSSLVVSSYIATLIDDLNAAAARATLGSGAIGDAVFVAATVAAARTALGLTSTLLDRAYQEYTTNADLSTVIPYDDTIPQSTEGTQIVSASITPKSTSSRLRARFQCEVINGSAATNIIGAMFVNAGANAVRATVVTTPAANLATQLVMEYEFAPGSVSAQTIAVRIGPASAGNIRVNGSASGRLFGGVSAATLVLEELG